MPLEIKDRLLSSSSLEDYRGRKTPPLKNSRGNYYRSAFGGARYMYLNGGVPTNYAFTQNYDVFTMLFMSDKPVLMHAWSSYAAVPATYPATNYHELMRLFGDPTDIGVTPMLTVDVAEDHLPGRIVRGTSVPNGVDVQGFLTFNEIQTRGELLAGEECTLILSAMADSGVIAGPWNYIASAAPRVGLYWSSPIVLRGTDYTQAMRDAGDLLIYTVGGVVQRYEIVGIFNEHA